MLYKQALLITNQPADALKRNSLFVYCPYWNVFKEQQLPRQILSSMYLTRVAHSVSSMMLCAVCGRALGIHSHRSATRLLWTGSMQARCAGGAASFNISAILCMNEPCVMATGHVQPTSLFFTPAIKLS